MSKSKFHGISAATFLIAMPVMALPNVAFAQTNDELDEIIVTGSPLNHTLGDALSGVSILTGDELAERIANNIGETLKLEPGVSSTFFGAGASRPIIRGQDGDRVRVLDNGIGSIDASSTSPDHAVAVEPAQAERIEVLRGAAVLRYGSSGAGGIVNVIDGRIPTEVPEDGLDGALRVGGSTVDNGFDFAGSLDGGLGENFAVHIDGTFKDTDDFDIPENAFSEAQTAALLAEGVDADEAVGAEGQQPNSAVRIWSASAGASWGDDWGFFGVSVRQFESEYGITEGAEEGEEEEEEGGEEEGEEAPFIDLEQTRIDVRGEFNLNGFFEKLSLFAGYADYDQFEFEAPGEAGSQFTNEGVEIRLEAVQAEIGPWQGAYGGQIRVRDFGAFNLEDADEGAFIPPSTTEQYALYTFQEYNQGPLHLEGAARYERTDIENDSLNITRDFDAFSISGGAGYDLSEEFNVGLNLFRTQRAPSAEELFSNGAHLATAQFEIGDADLDLETALGGEIKFKYSTEKGSLLVNAFYTDYDDYVFQAETGEIVDGLTEINFSGADVAFRGVEVQGNINLAEWEGFNISTDALIEVVRAEGDDVGNLPRIPPLGGLVGLSAKSEAISLRAELDWAAAQDNTATFELPTEGFAQVNLFASYNTALAGQDVTFRVSAHNLFDAEARQHTSFLKDILSLPGRNVRFSVATNF